jgi:replicative DNA helicase
MTIPDMDTLLAPPLGWRTLTDHVHALTMYAENPQKRVRTGLGPIDILIGGPACGEVCTFIGRSYSGKSIIAQNILWHNRDLPMIFFSLEMPALLAVQRLYSIWADHSNREVIDAVERGIVPMQMEDMPAAFHNHLIIDRSGLTTGDIFEYIQNYTTHYGEKPAAVVIDYLEIVGGAKTSGEGWTATEKVAQQVKELAKEADVPIFLLHQANKAEFPWLPPTLDSARGGGATEADFVIGLYRPHLNPALPEWERKGLEDEVFFTVLKNRVRGQHNRSPIAMLLTESLRLLPRGVE